MTKLIFIDTETTGLAKGDRILEIAFILWDSEKTTPTKNPYNDIVGVKIVDNSIITPDGFKTVPHRAIAVHGITFARAVKEGLPRNLILSDLMFRIKEADAIVGHSVKFDIRMIKYELELLGNHEDVAYLENKPTLCTLNISRTKQPTEKKHNLNEVHKRLIGKDISNAHTALADTEACLRVYIALMNVKNQTNTIKTLIAKTTVAKTRKQFQSRYFATFKAPQRR
jgi:DNA polymerase-3 subunit epsilon